jgi:hypothetical protein
MPDERLSEDVYYPLHVRLRGDDMQRLREKAAADRRDLAAYAAIVLERDARRRTRPAKQPTTAVA